MLPVIAPTKAIFQVSFKITKDVWKAMGLRFSQCRFVLALNLAHSKVRSSSAFTFTLLLFSSLAMFVESQIFKIPDLGCNTDFH